MMPQDAGHPEPKPTGNQPPARPEIRPVVGRIAPHAARAAAANTAAPPALSAAPDFGTLLKALRRRWMSAAVFSILLGAVAAGAAWWLMTPRYTAFTTLKVLSNPDSIVWNNNPASVAAQSTYIRSQAAAFKSRRVILAALQQDEVKRLGLDERYPDVVDWLENDLKTEFADPGEFINVTLTAGETADAMTVLKNLTDSYMKEIVYAEQTTKSAHLAELEKIYADTSNNLNRRRENFKNDCEKVQAVANTSDHEVLSHQQQTLLENLHDAKLQRNQMTLEMQKIQGELKAIDIRDAAVKELTIDDAQVARQLRADPVTKPDVERLLVLNELIENIKAKTDDPTNPTRRLAEAKIAEVEAKIDKRREDLKEEMKASLAAAGTQDTKLLRAQLESAVASLTENLAKLDVKVADMEAKADKIGGWNSDLEAQKGEIKRLEGVLNDIGVKKEQLTIELKAPPRVSIWQNADLQHRDMKKQIVVAAAVPVGVILLVCLGVAWLDVRQRRVRSAGDVATGLGIRVVGAVPGVAHLERQLVGSTGEAALEGHPVLESFDALRTQLLRDDGAEAARVLMVTSAGPGEGKTTLAGHLASSLARAGRKTLLIDGDLRRPSVHQLFELPMQPGFSEVLLGEVEAADAVQNTTQDGLAIVAAGQWDREVVQALARDGLEGIFEKLREEFDFIVVDSHPVLTATDSLLIGQHVDAVILSVLRDVSQTPRVYAASQKLAALGVRVLGAVVNGADPDEVYAGAPVPTRQRAAG